MVSSYMSEQIFITLNGQPKEVLAGISLDQLIADLSLQGRRFAVELNEHVVPKSQLPTICLEARDKVEIVVAIGGG
jgi:sulfur carrier protein